MNGLDGELARGIQGEFAGSALPDARLNRRLQTIVSRLSTHPGESFPRAMRDPSELEAFYRFVNNSRVEPNDILEPHFAQSARRARDHATVLVAHDTTFCSFDGEGRVGLGPMTGKSGRRGFMAHVALAIAPGAVACPLGVVGLETLVRRDNAKGRRTHAQRRADPTNESGRWRRLIECCGERLSSSRVIHVMDREADSFDLFSTIAMRNEGFVIRLSSNRNTAQRDEQTGELIKLSDVLERMHGTAIRRVTLSRRRSKGGGNQKINPSRDERSACLHFAAREVTLLRSDSASRSSSKELRANLVHVWEPKPPAGEVPVEWKLLTTEPVDTTEQVLAVVDAYRARWLIEELFKALKTGCSFEKRQLETYDALVRALAMLLPMAWQLLGIRALSRAQPDAPADLLLSDAQIKLLRHFTRKPLPDPLTIGDALLAVAALGGHLKRNGPPGWLTLGRGLERLIVLEDGWNARPQM